MPKSAKKNKIIYRLHDEEAAISDSKTLHDYSILKDAIIRKYQKLFVEAQAQLTVGDKIEVIELLDSHKIVGTIISMDGYSIVIDVQGTSFSTITTDNFPLIRSINKIG